VSTPRPPAASSQRAATGLPTDEASAAIASAFALAREDPETAEQRLRDAVLASPSDPTLHWALARFLHDARNDPEGAERGYRRALELDERHLRSLRDYARLLHYVKRDLESAERLYTRATEAAPERAACWAELAHFLEQARGEHNRAEALYERALALDPARRDTLEAWSKFLHHVRRDAERARDAYRRATEAAPDDPDLWAWRAVFLQTLGDDPPAAKDAFERALSLAPDHGFALSNYALMAWTSLDDFDRAESMFQRAAVAEPERWSTHWWFAAFLDEARGDRARAASHYRRAVELQPGHAALQRQYQAFLLGDAGRAASGGSLGGPIASAVDTLSDRGFEAEAAGDRGAAELAYREALGLDGEHGPTLRRLAAFCEADSRIDEAESLLTRAVELAAQDGWAHGLLARFLWRQRGQRARADHHYRLAVAAGLHDPKWLGEYAAFLDEVDEPARAETYFRRALGVEPTVEVAVDFARFLERRRGDADGAAEAFERALDLDPESSYPARQYARFLEDSIGDLDAAEAQYEQAVSRDPRDALTLAWFARFLERRRGDDLRAAQFHLRAARAEPERARYWAELARFLLARGLIDEAQGSLRRWLERAASPGVTDPDAPFAEACFLGLAYLPATERAECFERLKALLAEPTPLGEWDPEPHLEFVRASRRADAPWVERLARVLRDRMARRR
jgi:Tfp pilus assembly protein PilF